MEEKIKERVQAALGTSKIRLLNGERDKMIHLKGLDSETNAEEIMEALHGSTELKQKEKVVVMSVRPAVWGSQAATVKLEEGDAKRLILAGRVRIGLSMCRVEERIEVSRCCKCWKYGHRSYKCSNEGDMKKHCFKCRKEGNISRECGEESYCVGCGSAGHRMGTRECRAWRLALLEAKAIAKR